MAVLDLKEASLGEDIENKQCMIPFLLVGKYISRLQKKFEIDCLLYFTEDILYLNSSMRELH